MSNKPSALQKPGECIALHCTRLRSRRRHCEAHYLILAAKLCNAVNGWRALETLN